MAARRRRRGRGGSGFCHSSSAARMAWSAALGVLGGRERWRGGAPGSFGDAAVFGLLMAGYPRIWTVTPEPPEMAVILARMKLARTPETVRASPEVAVEVSTTAYCASASFMAVSSATFTLVGAAPKSVCQRMVRPFSGKPE